MIRDAAIMAPRNEPVGLAVSRQLPASLKELFASPLHERHSKTNGILGLNRTWHI